MAFPTAGRGPAGSKCRSGRRCGGAAASGSAGAGASPNNDPGPAKTVERDNVSYVTIGLRKDDYEEFYNGFANRVLWPILHYRLDLAEFTRRDLSGYFRVNEFFASNLEKLLQPDDVVWVHDYHLIPLAKALRERGHKNKIGFFIHIPCPPPEILTALPNHERLIPFARTLRPGRLPDRRSMPPISRAISPTNAGSSASMATASRSTTAWCGSGYSRSASRPKPSRGWRGAPSRSTFVREVLGSLSGRAMIIGVDRLDYSKGIPERMNAFERFLTSFPGWRGSVTYLQITPHSRSGIPEYAQIARMLGEAVGRINGTFGEASWTPVRYINKSHSRTALAGLYRAARAALVTPLRDGMNLVAKEYVAAQNAGGSRRADPVALCRRRARMRGRAAGQSV